MGDYVLIGSFDVDHRLSIGSEKRIDISVIEGEWEITSNDRGVFIVNIDTIIKNIYDVPLTKYGTINVKNNIIAILETDLVIIPDPSIKTFGMPDLSAYKKSYGMIEKNNEYVGTYFKTMKRNINIYGYGNKLILLTGNEL